LLGRVAWLQIIKPDNLVKQEDMRSLRQLAIDAPRGMIVDREGRPLAVSVPVRAVWADPKTVLAKGGVGFDERWQALANALHLSLAHSRRELTPTRRGALFILPVRLILLRQMDR
jgi:cell division protein FtsI (penicillin-binding protein 3)